MSEGKTKFLIDANSLITPYRDYYSFDLAPKFWTSIESKIKNGSIIILDKVYDELFAGGDVLSDWILGLKSYNLIKHKDAAIIALYTDILEYIQSSGFYTIKALTEWSDNKIADPWLIACAKVYSYNVVTFETPVGINKGSPSSHPKIPDICKAFDVSYTNLFDMMRILSISVS